MHRPLLWAGLSASLVACGIPLVTGVVAGWSITRMSCYILLALCFLLLSQVPALPWTVARRLECTGWLHLLLFGAVGLLLQAIGRDPFLQPIVFTVPVVFAALRYTAIRTAFTALGFLALMAAGLWLGGHRVAQAFVFPLLGYGTGMILIYGLTKLSVQQREARQEADTLAADLARQRDYLAQLAKITAALTRDLDLVHVLEQVAVAGAGLTQARQVRVWLLPDDGDLIPRLAATLHPEADAFPAEDVRHALHTTTIVVNDDVLALPLIAKGVGIGVLELSDRDGVSFLPADGQALQPFADAAAMALENARLYAQARESATLVERNRLARELHDTIAQGLTAVNLQLEAAQRSFERDPGRARTRVVRAAELVRATLNDVRLSVWTLASPLVDAATLPAALYETTQRFAGRTGIAVACDHTGATPEISQAAATQVLRIVQEALHNIEKHAGATEVLVRSETTAGELRVSVVDNGQGFDPTSPTTSTSGGFGLVSQRERARLVGGYFSLSSAPGAGTRVELRVGQTLSTSDERRAEG